jgi:hypothetical protein
MLLTFTELCERRILKNFCWIWSLANKSSGTVQDVTTFTCQNMWNDRLATIIVLVIWNWILWEIYNIPYNCASVWLVPLCQYILYHGNRKCHFIGLVQCKNVLLTITEPQVIVICIMCSQLKWQLAALLYMITYFCDTSFLWWGIYYII